LKQPKRPKLSQKKIMHENGLDWTKWNVVAEDEISLTVARKADGKKEELIK
jgi:hypothetical protein